MSGKSVINAMLARPLKDGSDHCGLLPETTCKATFLGDGDTHFSMQNIEKWIKKYNFQTKELANKLQRKTLAGSVQNIYDFLYNHFQYRADNEDQNLRSPSCACHSREKGIDCKSYSIFAGCLLSNMGISFYIRKIKQPGKTSNQFTHVYIVVPKDQPKGDLKKGYYVIDGTKHSNTEAAFTVKKDVFMEKLPHYGLNGDTTAITNDGPYTLPPQNIVQEGEPGTVSDEAMQGFESFIAFLKKVQVSQTIIDAATKHFMCLVNQGMNPYFGFTNEGFIIGRKRFRYFIPGISVKPLVSPTLIAATEAVEVKIDGLGALLADKGTGNETIDTGVEIAQIAQDLLKEDFFGNTIGAVFGNGWDLTCWNASNNPKKSAEEVALDAPMYFEMSGLANGITTQAINEFSRICNIYIKWRTFGASNSKLASCTRKGNDTGRVAMKGYYDKIISEARKLVIAAGGSFTNASMATASNYSIPTNGYFNGNIHPIPGEVTNVQYQTFKVVAPKPVTFPGGSGSGGTSSGGSGTSNTPAGYDTWDKNAKWLYEMKLRDGNLQYYYAWIKNNPDWRGNASFYRAMGVDIPASNTNTKPGSGGTLSNTNGTKPNIVKQNPSNGPTIAGGNIFTMLLLAGAAYGLYKNQQKKKKTTTKKASV